MEFWDDDGRERDTQAKGPDARAEALVASYERAGYARVAPAILQPAEPFLDLSGEDIRKRMYLTTAPGGGEFCLRPDLTIPVSRDYLASPAAGKPAGFCYLGPVFRHRSDSRRRIPAGRHRELRPSRQGGGRRRDAVARAGGDRRLRPGRARHPHRRRRAVRRAGRRARAAAGLEAAADQGFQPQDQSGAGPRPPGARRQQCAAGISGRAGGAGRLRSEGRACAGHRPVVDRRHQRGRRPLGRRDRRPLPRTVGARRQRQAAARGARADRALPRHPGRSRRGRRRTARARRRGQHDGGAGAGARSVRKPQRLPGRARHRPEARALLDRLRARLRLLHRLRVRTDRSGAHRRSAGRRRPL